MLLLSSSLIWIPSLLMVMSGQLLGRKVTIHQNNSCPIVWKWRAHSFHIEMKYLWEMLRLLFVRRWGKVLQRIARKAMSCRPVLCWPFYFRASEWSFDSLAESSPLLTFEWSQISCRFRAKDFRYTRMLATKLETLLRPTETQIMVVITLFSFTYLSSTTQVYLQRRGLSES